MVRSARSAGAQLRQRVRVPADIWCCGETRPSRNSGKTEGIVRQLSAGDTAVSGSQGMRAHPR